MEVISNLCIKVPKQQTQKTISVIKNIHLICKTLKVKKVSDNVFVPLSRQPSEKEFLYIRKNGINFEICTKVFVSKNIGPKNLVDALKKHSLNPLELSLLPRSIEIIGDIAIIKIPLELDHVKAHIGNGVLAVYRNIRAVFAKLGGLSGTYRTRNIEYIAGENRSETIYKEYGCNFLVDVKSVYFSSHLSYERRRVSKLIQPREFVLNMFSGVGCFSIMIAKHANPYKIYSVDINPAAIYYMKKNIILNKVNDFVIPVLGDIRHIIKKKLHGFADRIIMQLPGRAYEFLDVATLSINPVGGFIHYYSFVDRTGIGAECQKVLKRLKKLGCKGEIKLKRIVLPIAPRKYEIALDLYVTHF